MRTPRNPFVLSLVPLTLVFTAGLGGCGGELDLPTPDELVADAQEEIAEAPTLLRLAAPAAEAGDIEEPDDPGLGSVSIGDESYPILEARQSTQQDLGCGPAMIEPEVVFAIDGVTQMIHFDLTPAWELPDSPTQSLVPGELIEYGYAQRCAGDCWVDDTWYLGDPVGRATVWRDDDANLHLSDVELTFVGTDDGVPVKVVLSHVQVSSPNG